MGSQDTNFVAECEPHQTRRRDDHAVVTEKTPLPPPVSIGDGMDELEIRHHCKCAVCSRPIGQFGSILFYKVVIETHNIDLHAMRKQNALGEYLGSGRLAMVMGDGEKMTQVFNPARQVTVCQDCAVKPDLIPVFFQQ